MGFILVYVSCVDRCLISSGIGGLLLGPVLSDADPEVAGVVTLPPLYVRLPKARAKVVTVEPIGTYFIGPCIVGTSTVT